MYNQTVLFTAEKTSLGLFYLHYLHMYIMKSLYRAFSLKSFQACLHKLFNTYTYTGCPVDIAPQKNGDRTTQIPLKMTNREFFEKFGSRPFSWRWNFLKIWKNKNFFRSEKNRGQKIISINFHLEYWSSVFIKQLLISQSKWFPKPKFYIFWACIDPYKIPRPQGVKVIM